MKATKTLISFSEPVSELKQESGFALWNLGFRPFYLGASVFTALSMLLWGAQWTALLSHLPITTPLWHAHEMLFGFALAVIVGFLLTAAQVWSGQPTLTGTPLAGLFFLWLLGRIFVLTPFSSVSAVINILFPFSAAVALAIPLFIGNNRRNYFFVGVLLLFGVASIVLHGAQLGFLALPGWVGVRWAFGLVLLIMVVMAGRVIPMFSNNGVPGLGAKTYRWIEIMAPISALLLMVSDVMTLNNHVVVLLLMLCIGIHGYRLHLWRSLHTGSAPLVWVLHVAYGWIVLHLLLRLLSEFGWVSSSIALHAMTTGAIGTLTVGMMTRTSRGHLGLPLNADRWDVVCYSSVIGAAVVRVLVPMISPDHYQISIGLSAVLWSAGFLLFALRYGPRLCRPRIDGKSG